MEEGEPRAPRVPAARGCNGERGNLPRQGGLRRNLAFAQILALEVLSQRLIVAIKKAQLDPLQKLLIANTQSSVIQSCSDEVIIHNST